MELLRDNPFPKGVLGSKAIGEPPFMSLSRSGREASPRSAVPVFLKTAGSYEGEVVFFEYDSWLIREAKSRNL